jgi:hypothetical protein
MQGDLDRGEADSIALTLELRADLLLMDKREGRCAAQRMGLAVIGVVGVRLDARASGHLRLLRPRLDALRQMAGFFLSDSVCHHALSLAGVEPSA